MSERITYSDILDRCKRDVMDYLPDLPKENTLEAWESFREEIEAWRDDSLYDDASESVESWDWAIYTHWGIKILDTLPSDEMQQAESSFFEVWGSMPIGSLSDPWDMASRISHFALLNIWQDVAQECVNELLELAETQLENLE